MKTVLAYWDTENNDGHAYASCPDCHKEMCLPDQSFKAVEAYTPIANYNQSVYCPTCKIEFTVSQVLL
ncbi:hypothetical protein M0L20_22140 [Spirosoma sp. RP8]|uniref:Uncharacterized protein n=1 Tax=Spirosoma liriopis TaxID=2937440 RepID=A0ABT0HST7_9BACT|nr:hypothetical protein [Spirosoma liriopis]MCK8494585.1 hypothetical protein [Spirosoma liriopis]UHG89585.1 hypothetical protein LQ777_15170 [Spirosoma oryzicola]